MRLDAPAKPPAAAPPPQDVTHGKPHPETFLKAAEAIGVPPAACVGCASSCSLPPSLLPLYALSLFPAAPLPLTAGLHCIPARSHLTPSRPPPAHLTPQCLFRIPGSHAAASARPPARPPACPRYEDAPLGMEAIKRAGFLKAVDVTLMPGYPKLEA